MKPILRPLACVTIAVPLALGCSDAGTTDAPPVGSTAGSSGAPTTGGSAAAAGGGGVSTTAGAGGIGGAGGTGNGFPSAGTGGASPIGGGSSSGGTDGVGTTGGSGGAGGTLPLDGPGLYTANCSVCHGMQGAGTQLAPEIQHPVRDHATWVVRHGLPGVGFVKPMELIPPDMLSDANLKLIFDYLDQPPQPTTGQALYLDYCANCHGKDGKGGPTTRNILNELAKLKDQVRKGAHPGEFEMRKEYMPAFAPTRLTDAEVNLIYQYVDGL